MTMKEFTEVELKFEAQVYLTLCEGPQKFKRSNFCFQIFFITTFLFSVKEEAADERLTAIQTKLDGLQVASTIKYKTSKYKKTEKKKYKSSIMTPL